MFHMLIRGLLLAWSVLFKSSSCSFELERVLIKFCLGTYIFACGTLVVLKLGTCFVMNVPTSARMQSLKILNLHFVKLEDDDSIYRLIRGCPLLDELGMAGCVAKDVRDILIFAPVLTKLSIKHYDHGTNEIVLDTPGLLYLELDDNVKSVQGYLVKNLSDLMKVQINVGGPFGMESHEIISKAVTDLLVGISRVQHLVLQWRFIEQEYQGGNGYLWNPPASEGASMFSRSSQGCDDLDYAKELEVVTMQKLLRLPRGSKICQIEWVDLFSI